MQPNVQSTAVRGRGAAACRASLHFGLMYTIVGSIYYVVNMTFWMLPIEAFKRSEFEVEAQTLGTFECQLTLIK